MTTQAERMAARVVLVMMQAELTLDMNRVRKEREAVPFSDSLDTYDSLRNQMHLMQQRINAIDIAIAALA